MGVWSLKKLICLLILSLVISLCGCSDNKERKLVGTWQESNNPMGLLLFRADHTGRAYWPSEAGRQESEEMRWEILKGEDKVSVITPPGPVYFEIKGDRLVSPNGVVLKKVK